MEFIRSPLQGFFDKSDLFLLGENFLIESELVFTFISVLIYFFGRRTTEIFPKHVCKIKMKLKKRSFCKFKISLEGALRRAFLIKLIFSFLGRCFLIEVGPSSRSTQLKYISPAGGLLESSPNKVVK